MATSIPKSIRATLYIDGKPAEGTMKNLESVTTRLNKELRLLEVGTEAWNKKMGEVKAHQKALQGLKDEIKGTAGMFGFMKSEIGKVGALAVGFLGFQFVADQFRNIIMKNAELSDSLSDVRKTTGLSEEAVIKLNKELGSLNTRTSRKELLDLATVAGKLGITAKEDVLGFVKASNMIGVALGRDLGNTEEAVNTLGKLTDLFGLKEQFGLEESLTKIGSAINELGAAGTASEAYIVEFSKRLGTIAPAANISIENILGLAATMDELGQPAEAATTALSQFVVSMGKDPAMFAKVAGIGVKEFSEILQKDGNEALITVLKSLKSTGGGVQELASNMGLIGEDGARAVAALNALSSNLDKLQARQKLANEEFAIGDSLLREYNIKNENFAATLDKISKWFYGIATSKIVTNTLTSVAQGFAKWIGLSNDLSETLDEDRVKLMALGIELDSTNTSADRRREIITQLKSEYPDYLKAIDTEKASNEDLLPILDKINAAFVLRIAYQKRMETLNEAVQAEADAMNEKYDEEQKLIMQLARIKSAIAEDGIKFTIKGNNEQEKATFIYRNLNNAIREQVKSNGGLNKVLASNKYDMLIQGLNSYGNSLKNTNEDLKEYRAERKRIEDDIKNFKKSSGYTEEGKKNSVNSSTGTETPEQKAAREAREAAAKAERERLALEAKNNKEKESKRLAEEAKRAAEKLAEDLKRIKEDLFKDSLAKNDAEIENARLKYEKLRTEAKGNAAKLVEISNLEAAEVTAIYQRQADAQKKINDEIAKDKEELAQKIYELGLTDEGKEQAEVDKKYEALILQADKAGLDTTSIYLFWEAEKLKIIKDSNAKQLLEQDKLNKEAYEKDKKHLDDRVQLAHLLADSIGSVLSLVAGSQAQFANYQKVITGIQIAIDTAAAISAATKTGAYVGLTPIEKAIAIAGNIAVVLANIAKAKQLLSKAPEAKAPKFAQGGFSNEDPAGYVNRDTVFSRSSSGRSFRAGEAGREWIAPNWMLESPRTANIIGMLENARKTRGFSTGGSNGDPVNVNSTVDLSELTLLMGEMIRAQREANNKEVRLNTTLLDKHYNDQVKISNDLNA